MLLVAYATQSNASFACVAIVSANILTSWQTTLNITNTGISADRHCILPHYRSFWSGWRVSDGPRANYVRYFLDIAQHY